MVHIMEKSGNVSLSQQARKVSCCFYSSVGASHTWDDSVGPRGRSDDTWNQILYTAVCDSVLSAAGVTGRAVSHTEVLRVAIVAVDKQ
jgi:hypothetical protein